MMCRKGDVIMQTGSAALVEDYERAEFFAGLETDFIALRADGEAGKSYQDEVAIFDSAVGDGLENESAIQGRPH